MKVGSSLDDEASLSKADEENSVTRPNWEVLQGLLSKNSGNNQIGRSLLQSLWDGSLEEFKISR